MSLGVPQQHQKPQQHNRKFFRLPVKIEIEMTVASVAVPIPSTLADISEGGCRIVARAMLKKESAMSFDLPRSGKTPLKLSGVIKAADFKGTTRTFEYRIQFSALRPADRDEVYQYIVEQQRRSAKAAEAAGAPARASQNSGSVAKRGAYRVQRLFACRYVIAGQRSSSPATVLDVSAGGMRVAFDKPLGLERSVDLKFTLPNDVLAAVKGARPFTELSSRATVLPGGSVQKGRFLASVSLVHPSPFVTEEIARYVHAAQLIELRRHQDNKD